MTVSSNPRRAGPFAVNGTTTVFPFDFKVFEKSDVGVVLTLADGSYSFLTLDSDYSLALNADQDNNPGGSVTYAGTGATLTMLGALDYEQDTDITNVGRFLPQVLENALDKQTILLQQLLEVSDRTLQAAPGTSVKLAFPAPSSGKFIRWRPDLTGLENADASDSPGLQGILASATGAANVGFQAFSDITASIRTLFSKLTDTIDIRDAGAKGDYAGPGTGTVDTLALQRVIDKAIFLGKTIVDNKGGSFLTGPLDWNGTGHAEPANTQWQALKGFRGAGRMSTVFVAQAGAYGPGDWIIKARNTAGVSYQGFGYNGLGNAQQGFDFSWTGGQGGDPNTAPSNQNVIRDLYGEGVSGWGFNFDQVHDGVTDGIWSRGVSGGNTAFTFRGAGGQINASRIYASTGRVVMSCQNGGFSDCGFFGGYEITGSGFNAIVHNNVHFYPDPTTSMLIRSSSTGNAPAGCVFNGCFFNPTSGWVVGGNWWQGAEFNGCLFNNATLGFYATITPLAGAGDPPLFSFNHCTFFGGPQAFPGDVAGQAASSHLKCRTNSGASYTSVAIPGALSANSGRFAGLLVGAAGAVLPTDAAFSVQSGLARFNNTIAGQVPGNTAGASLGWNQSGGQGEVTLGYSGGGGSDPRLDIVNTSAGSLNVALAIRNASLAPGADNAMSFGTAARRASQVFAATATVNTSDRRAKRDIGAIPDAILDAWGDIEFQQFRFIDAYEKKQDGARWHFGLVAQTVLEVFAAHGLDAFKLGLLCFDEWGDVFSTVPAVLDEEGNEVEPERRVQTQWAGNRYGIRYEEALVLEAAWHRREMKRLREQLSGHVSA